MKWWKKWSFVIIFAITGIVYCGMDGDLLKITHLENLIPVGMENPEEDWDLLPGESVPDSMPEDLISEGTEESQVGEANRTSGAESESQGGEYGGTENGGEELPNPESEDLPAMGSGVQNPAATGETNEEEAPSEPEPEPEPEIVMGRVEEDYFADALFLGDSRTVGLGAYGSLKDVATFYAATSMTIYKLFGAEIVEVPEQKGKITVEEALQHQSFRKIYIMLGINEMGRGTPESFAETYGEVIARLQELQPNAIIYIEGILKVTTDRSNKGDYINNEGIVARNEAISQLADGERVFYLDVNQAVCDEDGGLVKDYTSDGVHLKAKYISLWEEYLKDNAVLLD